MNTLTTARLTGLAYLALAVTGMIGFLAIRSSLYVAGDPAATLQNLTEKAALAHAGVGLELLIVIAQALAALGFFALFRHDRASHAFGVASFGMANAMAILVSAVFMSTAVAFAGNGNGNGDAATVGLLFALSNGCWEVGGIFFGLWLVPMGLYVLSTRRMPRALGWLLVAGGIAYVVAALIVAFAPELAIVSTVLPLFATVGELWMVGYLLIRGIRPSSTAPAS